MALQDHYGITNIYTKLSFSLNNEFVQLKSKLDTLMQNEYLLTINELPNYPHVRLTHVFYLVNSKP